MTTTTAGDLSEAKRALLAKRLQKAQAKNEPPQAIGRRAEGGPIPLSFAQQRMWFLYQWEPQSAAYNIPLILRLAGPLDIPALERAFNAILRRHQVLQMIYTAVDEQPVLQFHPHPVLALSPVDLSTLAPAEREAELWRRAGEEARYIFKLEEELPIRAVLLRLGEAEHVLLLTLHHIATDGWSMAGVLPRELSALYTAFHQGAPDAPDPLPELPIQYADFADWQQRWLTGAVLEEQLGYWRKQLSGIPAVLELPTDHPRPPVLSTRGARYLYQFSPALTGAVKALAQREGVTPFMALLAAFQALLFRYSGQEDVVVGTPIANRNRSELEPLIGFFVNTLAIRTQLSGDPTVSELLRRVKETTLEAYAHQDLPFEKLVEELKPERNLSHNPIFQIMFIYQNVPRAALPLPDLAVDFMDVDNSTAKFDINFVVDDVTDAFAGAVTYNTDLFTEESIRRLVGYFETLLGGMVAHPERRISELPLITLLEREALVAQWTDTAADYRPVACLHQLFEEQVVRTPEAVAVIFEDRRYTYRELNARANQFAHHLQALGVGPDVRVGLFMEKSLDILVALLGILKAGGAYVPLDPLYPPDRVAYMLKEVQVHALATEARLAAGLPELGIPVVCLDRDRPAIALRSEANPPIRVTPQNLVYVLFTSGSTGRPKGVAVQHGNYLNYFQGVLPRLKVEPGMHFAMVSTFSTDLGTIQFWAPLTTGGTTHIVSYERATDPAALVEYFRRYRIDVLKLVPSHYDALQSVPDSGEIVPRHLIIFTGEASHWGTVAKVKELNPHCIIQDHYGVTETTCATLVQVVPDAIPADHAATLPLGRPLGNVRVYTLDKYLEPTPAGVPGELCIGGAGVTRGYFGRPTLTAERFVPDPFSPVPGARMYRTGDLAYFRNDGSLKLLGRLDFQIKIRGYRIEAGEIETALCEQPSIQDAVVIAREDTPGDRRLVAYLVYQPDAEARATVPELRAALRSRLPDYMVPAVFVTLDAIPLNPNGKVDRFRLPAPDITPGTGAEHSTAPRNEVEARLAGIWCEVLGLERVGIDDNFFDIGGESFKAIRVVRRIGEGISVMDLFKQPTIRELAEALSRPAPQETGLLHELTQPLPPAKRRFTLVCVPYGGGSAILFRPLAEALPKEVSLYAVQLPGHDYARQDALQPIEAVAQQCVAEIREKVAGPVALYGHCVGSALVLEIARQLEAAQVEVLGLFIGGNFPSPRLPGKVFEWVERIFPSRRLTATRAIYDSLRALGGFTDTMDPGEQEFLLQSVRHDSCEAENYFTRAYNQPGSVQVRAPILCIVGQRDRATELYEERYQEWGFFNQRGQAQLAVIPRAGHYFLKHQADTLAQTIHVQAAAWQKPVGPAVVKPPAPVPVPPAGRRFSAASVNIFLLVALGQFVSLIGTSLTSFAQSVWVYQENKSVSELALLWVAIALPNILLAPIAGAVADRWNRRWIMILSDSVAACGTLALAVLLWTGRLEVWHVYAIVMLSSAANAFQDPAYVAAIAQLVPKQFLGHANGIAQLGRAAGPLLAPLLGGFLVESIGLSGVVLIDFATFLFAVTVTLLVRFPDTLFYKQEEPFLKSLTGGWRYVLRRQSLVAMFVFFMVFNFLQSMVRVLVTPLVLSFGSTAVLGVVMSANGLGALVGSLVMSVWGGARRRADGVLACILLYGLSIIVMGVQPSPLFLTAGLFGIGLAVVLCNTHWQALIQSKVGLELQGRVIAIDTMLSFVMMPIGFWLTGPLADGVFEPLLSAGGPLAGSLGRVIGTGPGRGMGLMMVVMGVLGALWVLAASRYRPLREIETRLPDAIPDATIAEDKDALQMEADRLIGSIS